MAAFLSSATLSAGIENSSVEKNGKPSRKIAHKTKIANWQHNKALKAEKRKMKGL